MLYSSPTVTGTSVLAIKYRDGVMMVADTLGSYGSTAMFKNISRIKPIGKNTIIGAGGDLADFQAMIKMLEQLESVPLLMSNVLILLLSSQVER